MVFLSTQGSEAGLHTVTAADACVHKVAREGRRVVTRSQLKSEAPTSLNGRCFCPCKTLDLNLRDDDDVTEEDLFCLYGNTVETTNKCANASKPAMYIPSKKFPLLPKMKHCGTSEYTY